MGAVTEPDRQTDQHVAQHTHEKRPHDRQIDLCRTDGEGLLANGTICQQVMAGQKHQQGRGHRADQVADKDDRPRTQQRGQADTPARCGHHHQIVAGKQLRAAQHDKNEAQGKNQTAQNTRQTEGNDLIQARPHRRCRHGAQTDEGTGQDRKGKQAHGIHVRLGDANLFCLAGNGGRKQRIDRRRRRGLR